MKFAELTHRQLQYIAFTLWAATGITVAIFILTSPGTRTVTPIFWEASKHWIQGKDIYSANGIGFLYFPHSAILQIPFTSIPFVVAELLWRFIGLGLCGYACRLLADQLPTMSKQSAFLTISLFTIPLLWESLRNGQMNVIVTATLTIVAVLVAQDKIKKAVLVCILGLAMKPYLAVPLLLIIGVFPRRTISISIAGLTLLFVAPFFFQSPDYVLRQYAACIDSLKVSMTRGQDLYYAYLFGMLKVFTLSISSLAQFVVSIIAAMGIYGVSLYAERKSGKRLQTAMMMLLLSTSYILLFSSRTENNTFCLIAPFIGYLFFITPAFAFVHTYGLRTLIIISFIAMLGSYEIGKHFTGTAKAVWLAPLGLIVFTTVAMYVLWNEITKPKRPKGSVL